MNTSYTLIIILTILSIAIYLLISYLYFVLTYKKTDILVLNKYSIRKLDGNEFIVIAKENGRGAEIKYFVSTTFWNFSNNKDTDNIDDIWNSIWINRKIVVETYGLNYPDLNLVPIIINSCGLSKSNL